MFTSFWNTLDLDNIDDLNYIVSVAYNTVDQKNSVLERVDWILSKLNDNKNQYSYDIRVISEIRNKIKYNGNSLSLRGVDYLNTISDELKSKEF
jgi:hypothetical protein